MAAPKDGHGRLSGIELIYSTLNGMRLRFFHRWRPRFEAPLGRNT